MMKVLICLAAIVTSLLPEFSFAETPLDLGDIYVWGEDRSVLEGIKTEDLLLFPILNKSAFVPAYSGDVFEKGSPRTKITPLDGLYLHAGWGNFDEYLFRVAHGMNLQPWSFNWHFRGRQKRYDLDKSFNNRRFSGFANISCRPENFNLASDIRGVVDEGKISREFYQIKLRGAFSAGWFTLQPEVYFAPGKTEGKDASQLAAVISADTDIAYYHRISLKAKSERTLVDGEKNNFSRMSLNYDSRMFRDFTFSLNAGLLSGGGFEYGAGVSGDILDTGYRFYLKNEMPDFSFYDMAENSDALVFEDEIFREEISEIGIKFFRDMGFVGAGELKVSNKKVKDKIIYVQNSAGIYRPVNYESSVELFEVETALKNPPFYITFKYAGKGNGPRVPFHTNEVSILFKPEIALGSAVLKFYSGLKYSDNIEIWNSGCGDAKRTEASSIKLNAGTGLEMDSGIFLRLGVDNILEERIIDRGFFPRKERRFYVMGGINFPVNN